jgi:RNA polymerase sigma factor (TIGR02999 family)
MSDPASTPRATDGAITLLLARARTGDSEALSAVLPLVYDELRSQAAAALARERSSHTLQPTALVHEAWLRIERQEDARFENRAHFHAVAAMVMRRVLVDHARSARRDKRGGGGPRVTLDAALDVADERATGAPQRTIDLLDLDEALSRLATVDERLVRVVELRHFAGLSVEAVAEILGVAAPTVKRDWALAKAWLHRELATSDEIR